jgi:tetratricopeptide (TPR) repeat protein
MKRLPLLICVVVALLGGCKGKPKVVSAGDKLKAENLISEAQFSMQIREYSRAEELFKKAIELREDYPEYWVALGMARRRQDNKDGARDAYQKAVAFIDERYKAEKDEKDLGQKAWVMALLGKTDEAVKFLQKSLKEHPDSAYLQKMTDPRGLPHTFQTSEFKELSL